MGIGPMNGCGVPRVERARRDGAIFALVVSSVACGARTDLVPTHDDGAIASTVLDASTLDAEVDSATPVVPNGIVLNECGPADGPALAFIVAPGKLECPAACRRGTCPPDPMPPTRDVILLYRGLPTGPTTISFSLSGPAGAGFASSCREGLCTPAREVELTLTRFSLDGAYAEGAYRLPLTDGTVASGAFVATMCENSIYCG
jgi:hypothetical protein